MNELNNFIKSINRVLQKVHDENILIDSIRDQVLALETLFNNPKVDKDNNQELIIKNIFDKFDAIECFVDLKEELTYVADLDQLQSLIKELEILKRNLAGLPIEKRVHKEIRELIENTSEIRKKEIIRKDSEINSRIIELERNAPLCHRNHPMLIRNSNNNEYFWGCSKFPNCYSTRKLSNSEREFLLYGNCEYKNENDSMVVCEEEMDSYVSTTKLASINKTTQSALFSRFYQLGWVEKIKKRWRLTEFGKKVGGEYQLTKDGIEYIVWRKDIFSQHAYINDKNTKNAENTEREIKSYKPENEAISQTSNKWQLQPTVYDEMPQEKLMRLGARSLHDSELIALIIRTGTSQEDVISLCRRIDEKYGLRNLSKMGFSELREINGIGEVKACQLLTVFEIAKRINTDDY